MSETTPTPPDETPAPKPATRARKAPRAGQLVKLSDTGGYGIVVGKDEVCRLGPAEKHELETEIVE
jgi:hypothetical protein